MGVQFIMQLGVDLVSISLPAGEAHGIAVDNPTGSWLRLYPTYDYIPPYTLGWSRNFDNGVASASIRYEPGPAGQTSTIGVNDNRPTVDLYPTAIGSSGGAPAAGYVAANADQVQGLGVAGTPAGGVLTVQGIGGAGVVPVSGSITVSGTPSVDVTDRAGRLVGIVDTELPAAAALTDSIANPTTPMIGAAVMGWDAANSDWDRIRSVGDETTVGAGTFGRMAVRASTMVWDAQGSGFWRQAAADSVGMQWVSPKSADQSVTVTGGANAIATATLVASPGLFHYITHIHIARVSTAALAGGAILAVTTTNLNGRSWRVGNQASITVSTFYDSVLIDQEYVHPLKAVAANTNTTIVCPAAGAAVSWQIVVDYFLAP